MMQSPSVIILSLLASLWSSSAGTSPNIVFILMDDLGWHDVSFNGGQFPTPNIDALWEESVSLNKHYIHLMCSPSRTQFLTGRYAMRQGIGKMLPWDYTEIGGIPVGQPTIADWLKMEGYSTYAVGKWHCGYAYEGLVPTSRGFDHFFGFYQGAIHYSNMKYIDIKFGESDHYDFWEDTKEFDYIPPPGDEQINTMHLYRDKVIEYIEEEADKIEKGERTPFYMYIPLQTIHGPLDRVHEYEAQCDEILGGNVARRSKYCQNMILTDDVIGSIINTLKDNELWKDTLFVLTSDNGADIANKGCNFPLRGTKGTQFDGNTRTVALVGGGVIPTQQQGTYRDSLFSSLDWTPTLLHFARSLHKIGHDDETWDGVDQHDLLMKGVGANDENVQRDHIVFNIGLRNLDSASIVFLKDNHLYKYIAQDAGIDQWTYKRDDGWCIPDSDGNWNMVLHEDVALGLHVDDKYLFDLTVDLSERTNLLQLSDMDQENSFIIDYAKQIMTEYLDHSLYSEHLSFLWNRLEDGDPSLRGEGSYVAPFLSEEEYFHHLAAGFTRIEQRYEDAKIEAMEDGLEFTEPYPFTKKLKKLYFHKWEPPAYMKESVLSNGWYIYTIIAIVIVALITIIIISIARWRHLRSFYRDGYEPIKNVSAKNGMQEEEIRRILSNQLRTGPTEESSSSDDDGNYIEHDAAEYTHIDSNTSDAHTALIQVEE